jgi:murein endopeptidase
VAQNSPLTITKTISRLLAIALVAGAVVHFCGCAPRCGSIGSPNRGALRCGVQLKSGAGICVAESRNAWGTPDTIDLINYAVGETRVVFPEAPDLLIGHLSPQKGGGLGRHKSHQSGRDVDIGFFHADGKARRTFFIADAKSLDVVKTWYLIETMIKTGKVKYIFLDTSVQAILYAYLDPAYPKNRMDEWFEYPRPPGSRTAIIRHSPLHKDHMHVRFVCPVEDKACND